MAEPDALDRDPSTGQFMSENPLDDIMREPYAFGGDNPLVWGDPSGLLSIGEIAEGTVKGLEMIGQAGSEAIPVAAHAAVDVVAVVPYGLYYGAYYAANGINEQECQTAFGQSQPVTCPGAHILDLLFVPAEFVGLAGDVLIDKLKGESICDEGVHEYINPLHSFLPPSLRGPKTYLPGIHQMVARGMSGGTR